MTPPPSRDTIYRLAEAVLTTAGIMIFVVRAISESGYLRQRLVRGAHHRLGGDVELLVDVSDLAGGAEVVHADEAALSHIINSLLWPSAENELSRESSCDGKSSIKRAATMLAPEGDRRSLSDFQIVEARLVTARSFGSWAKRAASCQASMSCLASADNTLNGVSPFS